VKSIESSSDHPVEIGLGTLWREFLPLSLSDVTMACGDPMITTTLAHLPAARLNIAAVGIAKSLAVFFESPIIMILHASNALAPTQASRQALWQFTWLSGGGLSLLLSILALPMVFETVGHRFLGIPLEMVPAVSQVLLLMGGWVFAIAWRRYFQGLLIYHGQSRAVANASLARLATLAVVLATGFWLQVSGAIVAGSALMSGVLIEALIVTILAYRSGATVPPQNLEPKTDLPRTLRDVWRFYFPLANSMLVVWGGRALLISIIARAQDATIAIAAWSAAWGLVLVIANSTRMVQQMVIKYRHQVRDHQLLMFALTVGGVCSGVLLLMSSTPAGDQIVQSFIGSDRALAESIKPVLLVCAGVPLLVAIQNATQGFLVSEGRTGSVNLATWLGTGILLLIATVTVSRGMNGAMAAAIAMVAAISTEVICLLWKRGVKLR
jgi:progressive ankylosis protein